MNVFLTGGSGGIGEAIITKMSKLYENVIFTFHSNASFAEVLTKKYSNVHSYKCDLRDYQSCLQIAEDVRYRFGRIDILINNAGYDNDTTFVKMNKDIWDDVINVNLNSVFNFTHCFSVDMLQNGWGRIINVSSIAAFTGAFGKSNYAAAKSGIIGFTKSLAQEFAAKGVTVNAVVPGAIETEMLLRIPEKFREGILKAIPLKRYGKPEEVAELICFLASSNSSYITGQSIHINGGSYLY